MTMLTRNKMIQQLRHAAELDPRIVGLLDYGSSSEGRGDTWSDIDVALFIHDADLDSFEQNWKIWAAQFGNQGVIESDPYTVLTINVCMPEATV